jgi:hypothetical protein
VLAVENVLPRELGLGRNGVCELTFLIEKEGEDGPGNFGEVAAMMRVFAD